jgi:hypothetical protein
MNPNKELNKRQFPLSACAASFERWSKTRGGWPRCTHEEAHKAAWNDAILAAANVVWRKRNLWSNGNEYSQWGVVSAEEVLVGIKLLVEPHAEHLDKEQTNHESR